MSAFPAPCGALNTAPDVYICPLCCAHVYQDQVDWHLKVRKFRFFELNEARFRCTQLFTPRYIVARNGASAPKWRFRGPYLAPGFRPTAFGAFQALSEPILALSSIEKSYEKGLKRTLFGLQLGR